MRLLVALALTFVAIPNAAADGETSPMFGGAVIGGASSEPGASVAGVELDAAMWWQWFGVAVEVSARAPIDADDARTAAVVGGSVRVRLLQALVPSLLEPSDVEVAVELQGIVERTVWHGALGDSEPYVRGIGVALRLRGSTDDDVPRLITESRFFVRAMWWQPEPELGADLVARTSSPRAMPVMQPHETMVLVGIGIAFGGGETAYLRQFRRRPLESALLPP